jgi:hypothetical protein
MVMIKKLETGRDEKNLDTRKEAVIPPCAL